MILLGSIVNVLAILLGGGIGLLIHRLGQKIPERFSERIMQGLGLCVLYIAADGLLDGSKTLVTIFSMVLGALLGEWLDLDGWLERLSGKVERRFSRAEDHRFSQGLMSTTLLFCVGAMAIKGALDSGLNGSHALLYTKALMDGTGACIFASSMGVGVLFSSVPVFLYQGAISILATVAAPFLSETVIAEMNTVGSLLLIGLSMNMLGVTKLKLMNYVPAMFLPIILCLFL